MDEQFRKRLARIEAARAEHGIAPLEDTEPPPPGEKWDSSYLPPPKEPANLDPIILWHIMSFPIALATGIMLIVGAFWFDVHVQQQNPVPRNDVYVFLSREAFVGALFASIACDLIMRLPPFSKLALTVGFLGTLWFLDDVARAYPDIWREYFYSVRAPLPTTNNATGPTFLNLR